MLSLKLQPSAGPAHHRRNRATALVIRGKSIKIAAKGSNNPSGAAQNNAMNDQSERSSQDQRDIMQQRLQQSATKEGGGPTREGQPRPKSLESMEADEEYAHMNPVQKWFYEAKNALYSWLKSGVEI